MEVIKKLGNNAAICKDNSGRELIALGLGIGFPKCPYTLDDLSGTTSRKRTHKIDKF